MSYEPSDAKSLFLQAVELTDSQQRRDFLDRVCRGNAELRRRVEQLLESHDDPGSLLRQPVLAEWQTPPRGDGGSASHAATGEHRVTRDSTQPIPGVSLDFLEPCTTAGRIGKLGQYEIIELVGYGGMGLVLKAFDTKLQRVVAIKLLSPTLAHNATAVKRFLREARAAAAVSHDHVVTIFAVEETSRPPYLVMEYIAGQSLQQKIDRCGLLDIAEILRIGMQITVAQFRTFVDATGYRSTLEDVKSSPFVWRAMLSFTEPDRLPVMGVSWEDAKAFCRWLSTRHNVTYDLPSEAQWEFACRAGSEGIWSCGQDTVHLSEHAVFGLAAEAAPLPVGSRQPNEFELFDMHGNADEWCLDWHKTDFYAHGPVDDPVCLESPSDPASGRVVRGGAWNSPAWSIQTANRSYDFPGLPVRWHGFRIAIVGDLKATLAAEHSVQM